MLPLFHNAGKLVILQLLHERLEGISGDDVSTGLVVVENCHGCTFGLIYDSGRVLLEVADADRGTSEKAFNKNNLYLGLIMAINIGYIRCGCKKNYN